MSKPKSHTVAFLIFSMLITSIGQSFMFVGIPWLLLKQEGGTQLLGVASFIINLTIFFAAPAIGAWMDQRSRKSMLIILRAVVALCLLTLLVPASLGIWSSYILVGVLGLANFIVTLDQSARSAYVQVVFPREKYCALSTAMEMQTQFAHLLVGALLTIVVTQLDLVQIVFGLAGLFAISTLAMVPIQSAPRSPTSRSVPLFKAIVDGAKNLRTRPNLNLISTLSYWPYITIQTGNFLVPVLVLHMLGGTISDMAIYEVSFAMGAILVGVLASKIMDKFSAVFIMNCAMVVFTFWMLVQIIWPSIFSVIWLACLAGFANSAIRVGRNAWLMDEVPSSHISRTMSFYQTIMLALKTLALGFVAWIAATTSPWYALVFLGTTQLAATVWLLLVSAGRQAGRTQNPSPLLPHAKP